MLLAYCAGLIAVCTGLLIIATAVTIQNYWMLRSLFAEPPGKHEADRVDPVPSERSIRYDSAESASGDIEWTGPVTPYTPTNR